MTETETKSAVFPASELLHRIFLSVGFHNTATQKSDILGSHNTAAEDSIRNDL
jgi:hypothetical protein